MSFVVNFRCSRCKCVKPFENFEKNGRILKTCEKCRTYKDRSVYMKEYRKSNPDKVKDVRVRVRDRTQYMSDYREAKKAIIQSLEI